MKNTQTGNIPSALLPSLVLGLMVSSSSTTVVFAALDSRRLGMTLREIEKTGDVKGLRFSEHEVRSKNGSRFTAVSSKEPARLEGWHGTEKKPLIMIFDESISIDAMDAIRRCSCSFLLTAVDER